MDHSEYCSKVTAIHDVVCPRCGFKAHFGQTGPTSYTSTECGHKELADLIEERELLFFPPAPRPSYHVPAKPKRKA